MTTSSTTSGELAKPQSGTFAPVSDAALRDHTTAPLRGVERVQDSGRAERVDATVAEGRRRARTGAAVRLPEPGRVAVSPHRLAGGHVVAGDDLVVTALLLGVERSPRTAKDDQPGPIGRRHSSTGGDCGPVGLDPHAANDAVALGSAKAGPLGSSRRCAESRRFGCVGFATSGFRRRRPARPERSRVACGSDAGSLSCRHGRSSRRRRRHRRLGDRSRSSGVGVHRQCESEPCSPVMPPVRRSVEHSAREQDRRGHRRAANRRWTRRRLATAQATRARLRTGMA